MSSVEQITIAGAGRSVTVTGEQWEQAAQTASQLPLPFPAHKATCATFLTAYLTIEDEMDRLRAEAAELIELYKERLPLRAVRVAIKVVRARKKLAEHRTEPLHYDLQAQLETFVAEHLAALDAGKRQAAEEAERQAQRSVPDMTGGTP